MTNAQKKALKAIVAGVGFIMLLIGMLTDLYSTTVGIIIALAIWIVGIPVLYLVGLGPKKDKIIPAKVIPAEEEEKPPAEEPKEEPPQA